MRKYCTKPLPHWCLTDLQPAFYDTESGTAIQMTARMYKKIEEIVANYNSFVDEINRYVDEFERGMIRDFECFKNCIVKTMNDYIETIDTKINLQDKTIADAIARQDQSIADKFAEQDAIIADAVDYMKNNLIATVNQLFREAVANGDITAELVTTYDEPTESITMSIRAINNESEENNG
ncbi:MAG: hypothetical protein J6T10_16590 [Methanobrevibacter sp.]|nr:hypothetical protein [Methanobrevibacter sp.]